MPTNTMAPIAPPKIAPVEAPPPSVDDLSCCVLVLPFSGTTGLDAGFEGTGVLGWRVGSEVSVPTGAGVSITTGTLVGEDVDGAEVMGAGEYVDGAGVMGASVETTGGDGLEVLGAIVGVGEATGGLVLFVLLSVTQTLFMSLFNQLPSVEMDTLGTVCFWDAVEPLGKVEVS
jgi:hypothetical protein